MIGLFINTVPVRLRFAPGMSLSAAARALHDAQVRLLPHQHLGLSDIQRAAGTSELFDTLVVFENYHLDRAALADAVGDLRVIRAEGRDAAHYPVSVAVAPGASLRVRFDYDPACFTPSSIDALGARFVRMLHAAADNPDRPLFGLPLVDELERHA